MKNIGLRYGWIGGFAVVIYMTILYVTQKSLYINALATYWAPLAIFMIFMVLATREDHLQYETARDFRQRIRTPFIAFVIINVVYWLFQYGVHLYDPALVRMELEAQLRHTRELLDAGTGDPQQSNALRQSIGDIQAELNAPKPQPLGPIVLFMSLWMIIGFGLSAAILFLTPQRK